MLYRILLFIIYYLNIIALFALQVEKLENKKTSDDYIESRDPKNTNIHFENSIPLKLASAQTILLNGSGVSSADYNNDGYTDLFFTGLLCENKLYQNLGDLKFVDTTPNILKCKDMYCTSSLSTDINNDNKNDIIVGTIDNGIVIFINQGNNKFNDIQITNDILNGCAIYGLAVNDLDKDGDLDIYVTTYRSNSIRNDKNIKFEFSNINGHTIIKSAKNAVKKIDYDPSRFYLNKKGNVFEASTPDYVIINNNNTEFETVKASNYFNYIHNINQLDRNWGLGCIFADLNNDYIDDLYICNDLEGEDFVILSNGGKYVNGAYKFKGKSPMFSMGVDVADFNNDGYPEIYVCDMLDYDLLERKNHTIRYPYFKFNNEPPFIKIENNRNMLFTPDADHNYEEIAYFSNVDASNWSWCPIFVDINLDGYQDLFITNGFGYDLENINLTKNLINQNSYLSNFSEENFNKKYIRNENNFLYLNQKNSQFINKSFDLNLEGISHGACLADLDNDGDEDIIINNFSLTNGNLPDGNLQKYSNSKATILENLSSNKRIKIRIRGLDVNSNGIGALIKYTESNHAQVKQIRAGSRYCSSDEPSVTFAVNDELNNKLEININNKKLIKTRLKAGYSYTFENEDFYKITNELNDNKEYDYQLTDNETVIHYPLETFAVYNNSNELRDTFLNEPIIGKIKLSNYDECVTLVNGNNKIESLLDKHQITNNENNVGRLTDFFTFQSNKITYLFELRNIFHNNIQSCVLLIKKYNSIIRNFSTINTFELNGYYNCLNWKPSNLNNSIDIFFGGGAKLDSYPIGYDSIILPYNIQQNKFVSNKAKIFNTRQIINDIHVTKNHDDNSFNVLLAIECDSIKFLNISLNNIIKDLSDKYNLIDKKGFWSSISSADINNDGKLDYIIGNMSSNSVLKKYIKKGYGFCYDGKLQNPIFYEVFKYNGNWHLIDTLKYFALKRPDLTAKYKSNLHFTKSNINQIFEKSMDLREINFIYNSLLISKDNVYDLVKISNDADYYPFSGTLYNDFNNDGDMELCTLQGYPSYKREFESSYNINAKIFQFQTKSNTFKQSNIHIEYSKSLFSSRSLSIVDVNNDFKPDIVIGDYGKSYKIFESKALREYYKINLIGNYVDLFGLSVALVYENADVGPVQFYVPRNSYRTSNYPNFFMGYRFDRPVRSIQIKHKNKIINIPITLNKYNYEYEVNSF